MSSLSLYLPPFASDYAGACSALFDYDCLVAVNDASCCTANYVTYDEPRWTREKKATFCMNLRMNDAIFGIDDKVLRQLGDAAEALHPQFAALVGTPVPAIIGADAKGLSKELEDACGVPAFGLATTGFGHYAAGLRAAFDLLVEGWAPKRTQASAAADAARASAKSIGGAAGPGANDMVESETEEEAEPATISPRSEDGQGETPLFVNLLGMTPLDYGLENDTAIKRFLEDSDMHVNASLFMGSSLDEVRRLNQASCNVAVSFAGVGMARTLEKRYGTPWVASAFIGAQGCELALETIRAAARGAGMPADVNRCDGATPENRRGGKRDSEERVLIVADQVIGTSLRGLLRERGRNATVASFFGIDPTLAEPDDLALKDEAALIAHLQEVPYDAVVGDPLLQLVPQLQGVPFTALPHPAVSSRLHWDEMPVFPSQEGDDLVDRI